jgi:methyl-accepting chemotaxis protein
VILLTDGHCSYANSACLKMFEAASADIRKEHPDFSPDRIKGAHVDRIFSGLNLRQELQRNMGRHFTLKIGTRTFFVRAQEVLDETRTPRSLVVEWIDKTHELRVEQEINTTVEAALGGDFSNRIREEGKDGFYLHLSKGFNQMQENVQSNLVEFSSFLRGLSQGDLTLSIDQQYQGIFEVLKQDCNSSAQQLNQILSSVNQSAYQLTQLASSVNTTGQDLRNSASSQASSLEETSAAMVQMAASIAQNSQNAKSTDNIATESAVAAQQGGDAVKRTVDAMRRIAQQISVVEEIASKTSLLALNATIEAAPRRTLRQRLRRRRRRGRKARRAQPDRLRRHRKTRRRQRRHRRTRRHTHRRDRTQNQTNR